MCDTEIARNKYEMTFNSIQEIIPKMQKDLQRSKEM